MVISFCLHKCNTSAAKSTVCVIKKTNKKPYQILFGVMIWLSYILLLHATALLNLPKP